MVPRLARRLAIVIVLVAPSAMADPAAPDPYLQAMGDDSRPLRRGFTLEVGFGGALTYVARERADGQTGLGPTTLSFGVGWFVTPKVALLARSSGTTYFDKTSSGDTSQIFNALYGGQLQYWANDIISLSAGPALAVVFENPFLASEAKPQFGFGGSSRVGFSLFSAKHHVVRLSWEVFDSKVARAFVFGSALSVEWQYF
ncbi:MAG: hypothetical protein JWO86_838 [Myxococcaceae bacterium]|nr:hypothetical protein [Myxococcaceae bacterium]